MIFWISFSLPTKEKLQQRWASELIYVVQEPEQYSYQVRESYGSLSDAELINAITKKCESDFISWQKEERFNDLIPLEKRERAKLARKELARRASARLEEVKKINEENKKREKNLFKEQINYIAQSFFGFAWIIIIPVSLLYAFGLGIGWVVKGFKRQPD